MIGVMGTARRARRGAGGVGSGSIREVRLLGRPPGGWRPGDRVAWAGRPYRVVADGPGPSYAHLRPEAGSSG